MKQIQTYVSFQRLLLAAVVLTPLLLGIYLIGLRSESDESVSAPLLLDTQPSASAAAVGLDVGQLAPDFEISTTDGRRVRLSDFRGRAVVVNFHALWCTSCLTELPEIKAAQEERGGTETFAVLAVNAGETKTRALEFVEFLDAPFTFGLDVNLAVSDTYRVRGLPATVFIDATGVIQAFYLGYTGTERLDAFLDAAITAQPPGELPNEIRLISSIPRERTLNVMRQDDDTLVFASRSLRCDAGYCARPAIEGTAAQLGLKIIDAGFSEQAPSVTIRYEPASITEQQVVDAIAHVLGSLDDPVYERELEVVFEGS